MSEWISVEERLPEYGIFVIVPGGIGKCYKAGTGSIWHCCWEEDWGESHDCIRDVTYWMPIPDPPKEGKNA